MGQFVSVDYVFLKELNSVTQSSNCGRDGVEFYDFDIIVLVKHVIISDQAEVSFLKLRPGFMSLFRYLYQFLNKFIFLHRFQSLVEPLSVSCQSIYHCVHECLNSYCFFKSLLFKKTWSQTERDLYKSKFIGGTTLSHQELVVCAEFKQVLLDALRDNFLHN